SSTEVKLSVDRAAGWQDDLHLARSEPNCAQEAGRPTGSEQLFRVRASTLGTRRCQLNIQTSIVAMCRAVSTTRRMDPGRVKNFLVFLHIRHSVPYSSSSFWRERFY